jgi:hypothetical protein
MPTIGPDDRSLHIGVDELPDAWTELANLRGDAAELAERQCDLDDARAAWIVRMFVSEWTDLEPGHVDGIVIRTLQEARTRREARRG